MKLLSRTLKQQPVLLSVPSICRMLLWRLYLAIRFERTDLLTLFIEMRLERTHEKPMLCSVTDSIEGFNLNQKYGSGEPFNHFPKVIFLV